MGFKREPAVIVGLVQAVLALAVSFGFQLSVEQVGSIVAVVAAGAAVLIRQQVSPTSSMPAPAGPQVGMPEPSMPAGVTP